MTRTLVTVVALLLAPAVRSPGQTPTPRQRLATVQSLKCEFTLMATGTWSADGTPQAQVRERKVSMVFKNIDTQEGSAETEGSQGSPSITAQLSGGYLHLLQIGQNGFLYTTTVFDKVGRPGTLKAVHTRHEYTEVALPGFTSRPEQYYGECQPQP